MQGTSYWRGRCQHRRLFAAISPYVRTSSRPLKKALSDVQIRIAGVSMRALVLDQGSSSPALPDGRERRAAQQSLPIMLPCLPSSQAWQISPCSHSLFSVAALLDHGRLTNISMVKACFFPCPGFRTACWASMAMFYRLPEARAQPARARRYDDKKRCMPPGVVVKSRRQRSNDEHCTWILFCSEAYGP